MTSPKYVTFEIPVYPLVRKFLAFHYETAPFMLTTNGCRNPNAFASYLYACLERYSHFDSRVPRKYDKLTETLTLGVGGWVKRYGSGIKLTPAKIGAFNDFVKQRFFEVMTQEIAMRTAFGMGIKAATKRFLDRYGITEDELSPEMAIRYYARYRRRLLIEYCPENPDFHAVILPHNERDQADRQVESGRRQVA